ncbi:MAG: DUF3164 family protein [Balneolales bacterium]
MPKNKTIAQQAGYARRTLKRKGIESLPDYTGRDVPIDYVPNLDLLRHFRCIELLEEAEALRTELRKFKAKCQDIGDEMYVQLMEENEIRDSSVGGFTMGTFDKTQRVLFRMDSVKDKNHEQLTLAGKYWNRFMEDEYPDTDPKQHFLYSVVNDLVFNAKEEIDTGLINVMNKYGDRMKNKYFKKFLEHLNQAYDLRHTKRYEIFEKRDGQGKYKSVLLTYSKVDPLEESS